ncbi:polymeric immunoglobulin receptor-like isoform X1 [Labrus bergylta]|uniref:polymeric immunoglobulin receptor-like isoform X1 n=1 Tax=Labrus bergylta TaxID=56723 RepID=UPI003313ED43
MRRFLLLLLSLMTTGSQASHEVKGCLGGWVDFTCPYPNTQQGFQNINVINKTKTVIRSTKKDEWEVKDRVSMYRDTKNKKLRVIIEDLQDKDAGEWKCMFGRIESVSVDIKLNRKAVADKDVCREPFDQTAYKTAQTTITCEADYWSKAMFFCKDRNSDCEDITEKANDTDNFLIMSIRNVSPQHHNGIYWCGLTSGDGSYRAGLRQIRLKVADIINFQRSPKVGDTFEYFCKYSEKEKESVKFICKGEDPSICHPLINTTRENISTGRFSMTVDQQKRNITITLLKVKQEDSGTYWCGDLSTDGTHRFFHRMVLTAVTSTTSTESPGKRADVFVYVIAVIVCAVVLLLFVLISIVTYKRLSLSKRTRHGAAAQNTKEDYIYEEIQERVTNPDSRHATKTVYATVDFPKNSSPSLHYSAISFQQSSGGEGLTLKPSSSACEYSSVKQSPSAANQASRPSEEPFYSTVNKNQ